MRCCRKELTSPDLIEGTAYFVCPECGDVREIENYRVYTTEEAFDYFEEKYGFVMPEEYASLSGSEETKVVKLPPCEDKTLKYYFGEGFYEIGDFASIDPNAENSIYSLVSSAWEWGLPNTYIALEGDGHTWLALDYSDSSTKPRVIVVETDEGNSLVVSNSFDEFISGLLMYEKVYDLDGNVIYDE